jgi:NitT/TauT family transport system permease protein
MFSKIYQYLDDHIIGIFSEPKVILSSVLKILPFILIVYGYSVMSTNATLEDERQKIYPSYEKMYEKVEKYAFKPNKRINQEEYNNWKPLNKELKSLNKEIDSNGSTIELSLQKMKLKAEMYSMGFTNSVMFNDTKSSLYRLIISMLIAGSIALIVSIYMGMYKVVDYTMHDISTVFSLVQPVAILPIIMIVFGVEDYGKIIFITLGVVPPMLLTTYLSVKSVPKQTIVKAKTLSASDFQVIRKVILPQILPHFINTFRLTLFLGWMLLLSAEMISADSGLGYRIMLEKRFTNMDIIIPYVFWIMIMSFITDKALQILNKKMFPWHSSK